MNLSTLLAAALAALVLGACSSVELGPSQATALATLRPTAGNQVSGVTRFTQTAGGLRLSGEVRGLAPDSEHGFHVHERGDCSAPDAMSAGGHFNPGGAPHGGPTTPARHAGDLPNLRADAQGVARIDTLLPGLTVTAGPASVVGRALVVHRNPDDYRSQPSGDSGARVACAVISRS
ncbi:superoxide dismutase family protein [Ramlibacter sp. AW1]|uniref:Superoxide dismutase [Cu-Zn] n=1 Tax=Ramlibacter aurantiacus TaxID=2801330 RepID=A0A937D1D5_9BURK|nr:superoxide dismutase family protein [Ramlibacter aurantiacus]MBL0420409.1 superoxide dismutase family protein [Ramlibacter aurantiacus]